MSRYLRLAAFAAVALLLSTLPLAAADGAYREEALMDLKNLEDKYVKLAGAMDAGEYTYRPSDGVRSVSELYLHVAAANFGIAARAFGAPPPAGFDMRGLEKSTTDKAAIESKLAESFAHIRGAIEKLGDGDQEKAVKMFGRDTTMRGALGMALGHMHEHLGQAIAYARFKGVAPPWSE